MTLRHAIVGTDKSFFTAPELAEITQQYAIGVEGKPKEALLLRIAVLENVRTKAGFVPPTFDAPLPSAVVEESLAVIAPKVSELLHQLLAASVEKDVLISELLLLIEQKQFCLNAAILPDILDWATKKKAFRFSIVRVIGERGRWLAKQNPMWSFVALLYPNATELPALDWETATTVERLPYFVELRKTDAAGARQLLESTWKEEGADAAKSFLEQMNINLSAADEDFLTSICTDKRKTVRALVFDLLAQIPQSPYQTRLAACADTIMEVSINRLLSKELVLKLPDDPSKEMKQLGIEEKRRVVWGIEQGDWLAQIIIRLHPSYWAQKIGDMEQTLAVIKKTNWERMLLQAITFQAVLHRDDAWLVFLYKYWIAEEVNEEYCKAIAKALSASAWQEVVSWCLKHDDTFLHLSILVGAQNLPLPTTQAQVAIRGLAEKWRKNDGNNSYNEAIQYVSLLEQIALRIAPVDLAMAHSEIKRALVRVEHQPEYIRRGLDTVINLLEMRHQINTVFD